MAAQPGTGAAASKTRLPAGRGRVRVTIHHVAERAGCSTATVSRAFTTPDLVHADTRARILLAADQLGYRPNRAARGLITGRTSNIGLIVADLGNPFFAAIVKAAQQRARESDHSLFVADTDEEPQVEADLIDAMAKQVDGIVLCASRLTDQELQAAASSTTIALVNRRTAGVPAVLIEGADGMRQTVEHLHALGHRRVAYLAGPRQSWADRERRRGLRSAGRASAVEIVEFGPFAPRFEAGLQAADLALAAGVTAVCAYDDLIALGVLSRLADRGVAVPEECSVIGFDDIPFAAMCTPALTTVASPAANAGRAAVDLLLDSLGAPADGHPAPIRRLPAQLIVRASTGAPAPRTA